jgi:hypothetical protein
MAVKINLKRYEINLKTCYRDCTVTDLESIGERTFENLMRALSDMPEGDIDELDGEDRDILMPFFEFLDDISTLNIFVPKKFPVVGREAFGKVERAKKLIASNPEAYSMIPGFCRIYMGDEWVEQEQKIDDVFSYGLAIFNTFVEFRARHEELEESTLSDQDKEDMEEAGGQALETFGIFGLLYSMCDGKPWVYNKLLNSPAEDVYLTLRFSRANNVVQKNLKAINERRRTQN